MATRRRVSAKDGADAVAMLNAETRATAGTDQRRCIGSAKFGIEAHEARVGDFPIQPSQKDSLGRMCKPHWNVYTTALRKAALARKASEAEPEPVAAPEPTRAIRGPKATAAGKGGAG